MSNTPERIYLSPDDAKLFAQKYGHPSIEAVTVGEPYVVYVHADIRRAELEAVREACENCILHNRQSDPPDNRIWSDGRPYVCEENAYRAIRALDLDEILKEARSKGEGAGE